ncbi:MAG: hypothetical protein OHK0039_36980 [Bacteroidia bacterium]
MYNLYGRRNPYTYYLGTETDPATGVSTPRLRKISLFGFPIPYISYTFHIDKFGKQRPE